MPELLDVLRSEFSDVADLSELVRICLRLLIASLLGGILGWDRTQHGKAAGMRTYMFVAAGSALFVLVPQQMHHSDDAISRVMQGLAAGVGFLGAGAILKRSDEEQVIGLTTAAGIWMTAAIGVAAGLGREATAMVSTLLALAILKVMPLIERRFASEQQAKEHSETEAKEQRIESKPP